MRRSVGTPSRSREAPAALDHRISLCVFRLETAAPLIFVVWRLTPAVGLLVPLHHTDMKLGRVQLEALFVAVRCANL